MTKFDKSHVILIAGCAAGIFGNLVGLMTISKQEKTIKKLARYNQQAAEVMRLVQDDIADNPKANEAVRFFLIENEERK